MADYISDPPPVVAADFGAVFDGELWRPFRRASTADVITYTLLWTSFICQLNSGANTGVMFATKLEYTEFKNGVKSDDQAFDIRNAFSNGNTNYAATTTYSTYTTADQTARANAFLESVVNELGLEAFQSSQAGDAQKTWTLGVSPNCKQPDPVTPDDPVTPTSGTYTFGVVITGQTRMGQVAGTETIPEPTSGAGATVYVGSKGLSVLSWSIYNRYVQIGIPTRTSFEGVSISATNNVATLNITVQVPANIRKANSGSTTKLNYNLDGCGLDLYQDKGDVSVSVNTSVQPTFTIPIPINMTHLTSTTGTITINIWETSYYGLMFEISRF